MSARSRLALVALTLVLTACATSPRLEVPPALVAEQAAQPPLTCVDILVVNRPGFEARKLFGFITPPNAGLQTFQMATKVDRMMNYMVGEVRYEMTEAGSRGSVSSSGRGYHPSNCRSHVVTVIPIAVSQSGGMPPVATLQFTLYEVGTKRQIWQTTAIFGEGQSATPLAKALLAALQTLGMKTTPRPAVQLEVPGVPVNKGDAVATVRSTLGATAEIRPERALMPKERRSSITMEDRGVQAFFDNADKLDNVRLFPPYADAVHGVRIGDSRVAVLATMGEPTNEEADFYPFLVYRTGTYRLSFQLDKKGKVEAIWVTK